MDDLAYLNRLARTIWPSDPSVHVEVLEHEAYVWVNDFRSSLVHIDHPRAGEALAAALKVLAE